LNRLLSMGSSCTSKSMKVSLKFFGIVNKFLQGL
jgi:hypothetical protein